MADVVVSRSPIVRSFALGAGGRRLGGGGPFEQREPNDRYGFGDPWAARSRICRRARARRRRASTNRRRLHRPDDDMEERRQDILRSIAAVDTGDGAVLLTDMFGGTPSNLAISVMDRARIEVIAGVNLPMLIKLASLRQTESLERTVARRPGSRPQIHQRRFPAAHRRPPMSDLPAARFDRDCGRLAAGRFAGSRRSATSEGCTPVPRPVLSRPRRCLTPKSGCARTAPRSPAARSWA